MYFQNYKPQNKWLVKCLKSPISEHHSTVRKNCTREHSSYCFITSVEIDLENVLVTSEILGGFVNALAADDNYSLRNTKNLPQPITIPLSKKPKTFSQYFAAYLKST